MLRVDIFDRDFAWKAPLGDLISLKVSKRHNETGGATLVIAASHKRAALLAEPGARVRIKYNGEVQMTGPVRLRQGAGPDPNRELTFEVQDDFRIMHNFLGWPVPTAAITAQNTAEYYTITGPAETVVKDVVSKNIVPRAPFPVTVAADLARGSTIEATFRMHPLYDRLFPSVDHAGIGVSVVHVGAGLLVDTYVPRIYPTKLTDRSRVIRKWSFSGAAPEVTAGVVGGQGEGVLRTFGAFEDAAREALWGDRIEVFRDARDTGDGEVQDLRGLDTLAEGAATGTIEVQLAESGTFHYGGPKGVRVGDLVTASVGGSVTVTDVIREVTIEWTRENGRQIRATIGPKDDPMETVLKAIAALGRSLRRQEVST